MVSTRPGLLDLRGTFPLPALHEQGLVQRIGNGSIAHAIPIDHDHLVIHTEIAVFLHRLSTRETLWEIDCPSFNFALDIPGNMLAVAPEDGTIVLWDLSTGQVRHQLRYRTEHRTYRVNPNGLEFNHDGSMLAAGMQNCEDNVLVLWNTTDGQLRRVIPMDEPLTDITTIAFHPTALILAGGSFNDHLVWFWDQDDGKLLASWDLDREEDIHRDRPYDLTFSVDGSQLFVAGGSWGLRIWDVERMQELARPRSFQAVQPSSLAVDPTGRFLAVSHFGDIQDQEMRVVDLENWNTLYVLKGEFSNPAFRSDGQLLAVSPVRGGPARLFRTSTGEEVVQVVMSEVAGISMALHPAGTVLVEGGNGRVRLWDRNTRSLLHAFWPPRSWGISPVAFAPGGAILAVARSFHLSQWAIDLWNSRDETLLWTLQGHSWTILALAFDPFGRFLASGSGDKTVRIWDLERRQQHFCLEGHTWAITSIAFAPHGTLLASGSLDTTVCLWNMEDGTRLGELRGHTNHVRAVAFCPDGRTLASGDEDGGIVLWSVAERKQMRSWRAHTAAIRSLAFSADGRWLASGSKDQTVHLWDAASGQDLACLKPSQGEVHTVTFTANDQELMTGAVRCARFWNIETLFSSGDIGPGV